MKPVVVMTQTSEIQSDLVTIIHKPFIDINPLEFDSRLLKDNYDWLIFRLKMRLNIFGRIYILLIIKNCSCWWKTAQYCRELKIPVDLIPQDYSQEGLISEFQYYNQSILIPSSKQARPLLKETLGLNNDVVKIDLYEPVPHYQHIKEVKSLIFNHKIDALTFSSSSSVRYYFSEDPIPKFDHYFAIGKQTANTLHSYNQPVVVANKQTLESLIDKVVESRD